MPFKSKAQWKACWAKKRDGTAGSWDCGEWTAATKTPFKKLPEHTPDSPAAKEAQLREMIDYPVFFTKLAAYGIIPSTAKEAWDLIELAARLSETPTKEAAGLLDIGKGALNLFSKARPAVKLPTAVPKFTPPTVKPNFQAPRPAPVPVTPRPAPAPVGPVTPKAPAPAPVAPARPAPAPVAPVPPKTVNIPKPSNFVEAGKALTGAGLGGYAGYQTGEATGMDPTLSALTGAMGGTLSFSRGARNQLAYMGRVGEAAPRLGMIGPRINNPTLASLYNFGTRPRYPGIEPLVSKVLPKAGPKLFNGIRALPAVNMLAGMGVTGYNAMNYLPNTINRLATQNALLSTNDADGLQDAQNKLRSTVAQKQTGILAKTMAPSWTGLRDETPVGDMHRDVVKRLGIPDLKYGITRARQQEPYLFGTMDALRSLTPVGAAATHLMTSLAPKTAPDYNGIMAEIQAEHLPKILANPEQSKQSPLAKTYGTIAKDNALGRDMSEYDPMSTHIYGALNQASQIGLPYEQMVPATHEVYKNQFHPQLMNSLPTEDPQ